MTTFDNSKDNNQTTQALAVLSTLFFMWGLITVFSGILIENELKNAFELTYNKAILLSVIFFATYFVVAFPAGVLIDRIGFKNGIISGLLIAAVGCLTFYLAASKISYPLTVTALFILASGITILQVCANPYVVMIGMRGRGASRLTLVGAFNSLGTVIASYFGTKLVASESGALDPESIKAASAEIVKGPYLLLAGILCLLAIFIGFSKLPKVATKGIEPLIKDTVPPRKNVFQFHHVVLGAIAIFAYVGAEVGIFNYLLTKSSYDEKTVDTMIKCYWGAAMVGRFIGAAVLTKISPRKMMAICSTVASLLVLGFIFMVPAEPGGDWNNALWMLVGVGLFNSVLFPCIFAMGIDGLGQFAEEGSSMLIMAIVGGSVVPYILLRNIDASNPSTAKVSFLVLIACYLFILFYGLKGSRYEKRTNFY
ncbi:MAG: sugar MFS transporter [Cytophagaceae bacterium]